VSFGIFFGDTRWSYGRTSNGTRLVQGDGNDDVFFAGDLHFPAFEALGFYTYFIDFSILGHTTGRWIGGEFRSLEKDSRVGWLRTDFDLGLRSGGFLRG
jgi:hypothetical protein